MRIFDDCGEQRAHPRFKLFQSTDMSVSGQRRRVHVLNLSAGGAMVYASAPPAPGTRIRIDCGDASRPARVAWARDKRFGISFAVALAEEDVAAVIADQQALVAAAARRIGMLAAA